MTDIKERIYHHFYTRKRHFILGKPTLTIFRDKDRYDISAEYKDKAPWFRVDHGVAHIYFSTVEDIAEFIEKNKEL